MSYTLSKMQAPQATRRRGAAKKVRYIVIGGPGGYMSMVSAGSPILSDRYKNWTRLATVKIAGEVDQPRLYRIYGAVRRVWELV